MENFSPAADLRHSLLPASLYSQEPPTHSMVSGAPVLKVSVAGRITPTDFLVPSASTMPWLTHLPSKYTLARVVTLAPERVSVLMDREIRGETRDFRGRGYRAHPLNPSRSPLR